jgi:hypothetical protein
MGATDRLALTKGHRDRMKRLVLYGTTGKFTWRMLATVLAGQSIIIFFGALVARGLAATGPDSARAGSYLLVGSVLAVVCLLGSGLMRRPYGVTAGWVVQALTLASGLIVPMMFVAGAVFLALWVASLVLGGRIDHAQAPVG